MFTYQIALPGNSIPAEIFLVMCCGYFFGGEGNRRKTDKSDFVREPLNGWENLILARCKTVHDGLKAFCFFLLDSNLGAFTLRVQITGAGVETANT